MSRPEYIVNELTKRMLKAFKSTWKRNCSLNKQTDILEQTNTNSTVNSLLTVIIAGLEWKSGYLLLIRSNTHFQCGHIQCKVSENSSSSVCFFISWEFAKAFLCITSRSKTWTESPENCIFLVFNKKLPFFCWNKSYF